MTGNYSFAGIAVRRCHGQAAGSRDRSVPARISSCQDTDRGSTARWFYRRLRMVAAPLSGGTGRKSTVRAYRGTCTARGMELCIPARRFRPLRRLSSGDDGFEKSRVADAGIQIAEFGEAPASHFFFNEQSVSINPSRTCWARAHFAGCASVRGTPAMRFSEKQKRRAASLRTASSRKVSGGFSGRRRLLRPSRACAF